MALSFKASSTKTCTKVLLEPSLSLWYIYLVSLPDGEDMSLGGEDVALAVLVHGVVDVEEEVEVLARLREEEGLLPVLQGLGPHVVDGGVAAVGAGVLVQREQDVPANVEVERVLRGLNGGGE